MREPYNQVLLKFLYYFLICFNEAYTTGVAPAAAAPVEAKPKTRRSRKKSSEEGDDKKVAQKAPKSTVAKASAAKGAKRTNVGKKM